jgi:magnesium-transporting ATPase (P-type)
LANVVNLDNHHHEEGTETIIASKIIQENFGGIDALVQALHTDVNTGISGDKDDIADRKRMYGANFFPPPKIKSLGEIIMANFDDFINRVLLGACIVSLIIGNIKEPFPEGLIEGTSIAIALTIIIVVGSSNEYTASQRLRELIALSDA